MIVPLLDLKAQYATIRDKVRSAVDLVLEGQRFILGSEVAQLEGEIASLCGVPAAIAVASGTDALLISLKAAGVGPGDAAVTVPYTFFATAGTIVNLGARPIFVDIEESGFTMDAGQLADLLARECVVIPGSRQLTHRRTGATVKAIVPVHLYGQCADMDEIVEIGRNYNLAVIEDACQAIGAKYREKVAGALGDAGCFSFFPSKNLGGAGDGGMVVTRNRDLGERIRLLRTHGAHAKYFHSVVGFNSRLDEIQAAVLRVKLPYLEQWSQARRRNAEIYSRAFEQAGVKIYVKTPPALSGRSHIFHQYVIRCHLRDELQQFLKGRGIGTEVYYPLPLHEQECFKSLGYRPEDFPRAHDASKQTLALPVYPELTEEQLKYVVDCIAEFYRQNS
jgi:dTDP-4-amino-4,6-dideoxygalactose transaminase